MNEWLWLIRLGRGSNCDRGDLTDGCCVLLVRGHTRVWFASWETLNTRPLEKLVNCHEHVGLALYGVHLASKNICTRIGIYSKHCPDSLFSVQTCKSLLPGRVYFIKIFLNFGIDTSPLNIRSLKETEYLCDSVRHVFSFDTYFMEINTGSWEFGNCLAFSRDSI